MLREISSRLLKIGFFFLMAIVFLKLAPSFVQAQSCSGQVCRSIYSCNRYFVPGAGWQCDDWISSSNCENCNQHAYGCTTCMGGVPCFGPTCSASNTCETNWLCSGNNPQCYSLGCCNENENGCTSCSPVDGGWSGWSGCYPGGGGLCVKDRACNNPPPSCGGDDCDGLDWTECTPAEVGCTYESCPTQCDYGGGNMEDDSFSTGCTCATHYCPPTQPCSSCTISPAAVNVDMYQSAGSTATVTTVGGWLDNATFDSGNWNIASVTTYDGGAPFETTVTGVSGGSTTLNATGHMNTGVTCSGSANITVNPVGCTVSLNAAPGTYVGGTAALTATTTVVGGTITNVGFVSSNTGVATLNPSSDPSSPYTTTATGVSMGTSTITATGTMNTGNTCQNTTVLTVRSCTLNITITPASATMYVGETANLNPNAVVQPSGTMANVNWASSNTNVVTVSPANNPTSPYGTTATASFDGLGNTNGTATVTAIGTMTGGGTCMDTSAFTVRTCSANLDPYYHEFIMGDPALTFTSSISQYNQQANTSMSFYATYNDPAIISINPASDPSSPYATSVAPVSPGAVMMYAQPYLNGVLKCNPGFGMVTVAWLDPWWQVKDADVSTNGDLNSPIADTADYPYFDDKGPGNFPGVPAYGGLTDTLDGDNASELGWLANSSYNAATRYDFNYFYNAIPSGLTPTIIDETTIGQAYFNNHTGTYDSQNNEWFEFDASIVPDLTFQGAIDIGSRKIIIFVKDGNAKLDGTINLLDGSGLFLLITEGNTIVNPGVGGGVNPNLEGIFISDGNFQTGTTGSESDNQLRVRGSIAAYGDIDLERHLGAGNSTIPAELFELAPDLALHFPNALGARNISWHEVAP